MGFDRRSFISLVVGGAVGTTLTPVIWKTLDDVSIWSQNWSWIPRLKYGAEGKRFALCKLGADAYGIKIKTIAGNPVVAEGDPDHPLSLGGICPLGAASVQLLYSPSRVRNPKVKDGNTFKDISWEEAESLLAEKIKAAGSNIAMVSGDETGSVTDILTGLVGQAGSKNAFLMPSESGPAAQALALLGGDGQIGYDLENSDCILMLGADVLGSWGNVTRNGKAFAAGRKKDAQYVYVGPAQNGTAAVADKWVPCAPGTEAVLAMGLAGVIIADGGGRPFWSGFSQFSQFVSSTYPLEKVAQITGVPAETIKELAQTLGKAKHPLVLTAAGASQGLGAFEAVAGMCLNMLLERINETGGVRVLPWNPRVIDAAMEHKNLLANDLVAYLSAIADGSASAPAVFMIYGANPAHSLPNLAKVQAALEKADFLVSFSSFMDETAALADLIMPDSYGFERLDDSYSPYGSAQPLYTVAAPIIKPVYDTKPAGDVLLSVASAAGLDLGFDSFEDVVQAKAEALGADYDDMVDGTAWVGTEFPVQDLELWSTPLREIEAPVADGKSLALAPVVRLKIGSSKLATPPFGTNAIRYDEMSGREMYVLVNGVTAKNLGLQQDDAVKLTSASGECQARLRIFEGVMDNTVVAPLGFGHTAWDDFSRGKGDNVFKLLPASTEDQTGVSRFATVQVVLGKA